MSPSVNLPLSLFKTLIASKKIYRFSLNYKNNPDPHFYICVAVQGEIVFLSCCTSQFDSSLKHIKLKKLNLDTLVLVGQKGKYPFSKDTYVNCNNIETLTFEEIYSLYQSQKFEVLDELDDDTFETLIKGLLLSTTISKKLQKFLMGVE